MNLSRFKYILLSQVVLLPFIYAAKLISYYFFSFLNPNLTINFLINLNESIFISGIFAIVLSVSKKVITRFLDDTFSLKFNFTLVSFYLAFHYIISYFIVDFLAQQQNYSYLYIIALLIAIIYSNIRFKKILNDKK